MIFSEKYNNKTKFWSYSIENEYLEHLIKKNLDENIKINSNLKKMEVIKELNPFKFGISNQNADMSQFIKKDDLIFIINKESTQKKKTNIKQKETNILIPVKTVGTVKKDIFEYNFSTYGFIGIIKVESCIKSTSAFLFKDYNLSKYIITGKCCFFLSNIISADLIYDLNLKENSEPELKQNDIQEKFISKNNLEIKHILIPKGLEILEIIKLIEIKNNKNDDVDYLIKRIEENDNEEDEDVDEKDKNKNIKKEIKIKTKTKTKTKTQSITKKQNKLDSSDSDNSDNSDDSDNISNSDSEYDLDDEKEDISNSKSNSSKSNSSEISEEDYEDHNIFVKKLKGSMIPVLVAPCEKFVFPAVKDKVEEEDKLTNYFVKHYSRCSNCIDCDNNLCSLRSNLNNKETLYEYYYGKRGDAYMESELENYNKVKPSEDYDDEDTNIIRIIHIKDSSNIYYNNILVSWYKL